MKKLFPVRLILLALLLATLSMTACKIRVLDVDEDDDSPPDTVVVVVLPPDTVPPDTIPSDTTTTTTPDTVAKWIWEFTPQVDSAYISETIVFHDALAYIPEGMPEEMEISTGQCYATVSTAHTEIAPDTFNLGFAVMVIANCAETIDVRLKANLDAKTSVQMVGRTALIERSVSISPKGDTLVTGGYGRSYCELTLLPTDTDDRCWFYSNDPTVLSVVQQDRVYPAGSPLWGEGFRYGGEEVARSSGEAMVCAYWVSDPKYSDCAPRVVTAPSGLLSSSNQRDSSFIPEVLQPYIHIPSGHVPYIR